MQHVDFHMQTRSNIKYAYFPTTSVPNFHLLPVSTMHAKTKLSKLHPPLLRIASCHVPPLSLLSSLHPLSALLSPCIALHKQSIPVYNKLLHNFYFSAATNSPSSTHQRCHTPSYLVSLHIMGIQPFLPALSTTLLHLPAHPLIIYQEQVQTSRSCLPNFCSSQRLIRSPPPRTLLLPDLSLLLVISSPVSAQTKTQILPHLLPPPLSSVI